LKLKCVSEALRRICDNPRALVVDRLRPPITLTGTPGTGAHGNVRVENIPPWPYCTVKSLSRLFTAIFSQFSFEGFMQPCGVNKAKLKELSRSHMTFAINKN
jgi:hypothetical protein